MRLLTILGLLAAPVVGGAQEGLGVPQEIPTDPKWRPFDSLAWLAAENSKRDQEELNRHRMELYEAR